MFRSSSNSGLVSVSNLAREVALPHTPRLLRVQSRLFLSIAAAFLLLALPLALLATVTLRGTIHRTYAERALRESRLIATLPPVRAALEGDRQARAGLNGLINGYRALLGADYVVVTDRSTRRLTHPNPARLGERMVGGDFQSFLVGRSVTETVEGTLGRSVRAKVPVLAGDGRVLGLASVGFLLPRLGEVFQAVVRVALPWYAGALVLALLLASLLARRVRREMLDLEPEQIAGGLLHYRTVLNALEEGVLVVQGGQVHVMNPQARALLGVGKDTAETLPVPLSRLLPTTLLEDPSPESPIPVTVRDRPLLVSVRPAPDGAQVVTLRDLARMRALADELTQARRYADLLRAQTHEFTNRLHTLAGLLQLGETREALNLIYAQSNRHAAHAEAVRALRHVRLVALVLGKYERAAELGLTLTLDPLSTLPDALPPGVLDLIELSVGNLLENAFEALHGQPSGQVHLLIAYDPEGLVVEVRDNGPGVPAPLAATLTQRGVSSKGPGRGVGLALVQRRADDLGATLTHDRRADATGQHWTRFTLEVPL
ncbi:signal transduction histidine kinase regulating citrate/malate metabolism [Deinococcus geothermalis DSM 11300]|uniref:histidine kinase n=1 Tax=Deinococcus geothermalis (strain DSM 11300 / CIP 105573 / AG-3a) TaxID=319795 RepID=Q1J1H6_DEIGD|nr:sensor histidine kinase [Deinococcus geothermalis]ABF44658.1 signal transduction histidine kinase regulating citrate/malate metabolism [Deinococcus geothermalis DSM 11300]